MEDMRNTLLTELIDKMHSRMAEKAYPAEDKPPVEETVNAILEPKEDEKADAVETPEDLSDEDLAAMESELGA